ncbi:cbb3-type cytochrome c oxidase subunit 3 [Sphingomonas canadensis]|jgi:cytochrome c oxidase cbb3-type subunit 4|uniref:Cbb3-type cytochrome c oxidase subunit 3 n=1 Tax=Sphingomonas canadensis TaxID=1219257 RepID=A0ABW3H5I5_9SPHN|nr:cbb3-type cytochrome c oxidase subunit 3 [Sphingomonas canadensis]MCW3835618.1 cbb3-type cytochrome c oxidase subunit 3 [Sphingomonas canadensis]
MSAYDVARHFADSWGLVFLFGVFLFAVGRALRPSARDEYEHARTVVLRDEEPGK